MKTNSHSKLCILFMLLIEGLNFLVIGLVVQPLHFLWLPPGRPSHAAGDKRACKVVEAGWGKGVGGAAAIVWVLQCFGCGCLSVIRRVCNKKKTNPRCGFGVVIWSDLSIYLIQRHAVLLHVREKKILAHEWYLVV